MKIYVVTQGEYSDYHIITATTDKSVAEAVAKKFKDSSYCEAAVEEYEDAEIMLKPCWVIWFKQDGSVDEAENASDCYYTYGEIGQCHRPKFRPDLLRVIVSADNEAAAIKIAAERRAKFLAEEEGL
jgi:hypothetical protein